MADVRVVKIKRPRTSGMWGSFRVDTDWDIASTEGALNRVAAAVSGAALGGFMQTMVEPYLNEEIIDRFAYEGDDKSGDWAPLTETTQRIRESMGVGGSGPINERTGELVEFLVGSSTMMVGDSQAVLTKPGSPESYALEQKLTHAQQGTSSNPLFPGATTPPRPVLATDATDMEAILKLLQMHVMTHIAGGL